MKLENKPINDELDEAINNELTNIQDKKETIDTTDEFFDDVEDNIGDFIEKKENIPDTKPIKKGFGRLTDEDRNLAAYLWLVPKEYRKAIFDIHKIKENVKRDWINSKELYLTYYFKEYIELCTNILNTIRFGELPKRSYIIGAPRGFGKASFVNECIMTLNKNCYRVAPYISLYELGEIRKIDTNNIMRPYSYFEYYRQIAEDRANKQEVDKEYLTQYTKNGIKGNYHIEPTINRGIDVTKLKTPKAVYGQYSYSEYINSACVFVALSGIASKDVESQELLQLMNIRSMKGLPTIVTVGTSLDPYTSDINLREQVWDDLLTRHEDEDLYDRLYHVSTYKFKSISKIDNQDTYKDPETGIVYKSKEDVI